MESQSDMVIFSCWLKLLFSTPFKELVRNLG